MQAPPRSKTPDIKEIHGITFNKMNENFYFCSHCNTPKKVSELDDHASQHRRPASTLQDDSRSQSDSVKSSTSKFPPSLPRSISLYHPLHVTSAPSLTPTPPERRNAAQTEATSSKEKFIGVLVSGRFKKAQDTEPETLIIESDESTDEFTYGVHNKHKPVSEAIAKEELSKMKENEAARSSENRKVDNTQMYPEGMSSLLSRIQQTPASNPPIQPSSNLIGVSTHINAPNFMPSMRIKDTSKVPMEDIMKRNQTGDFGMNQSRSSLSEKGLFEDMMKRKQVDSSSNQSKVSLPDTSIPKSSISPSPMLKSFTSPQPKPAYTTPQQKSVGSSQKSPVSPIMLSPIPTTPIGVPTKSTIEVLNSFQSPQISSFAVSPPKLSPLTSPGIHHNLPTIAARPPNVTISSPVNKANVPIFSPAPRVTAPSMVQVPNSKPVLMNVETQVYGNSSNIFESREHLLSQMESQPQGNVCILNSLPVKRQRNESERESSIGELLKNYRKMKGAIRKLAIIMKRGATIKVRQGFRIWYKRVDIY